MALTAAERKRRQLERERAALKLQTESTHPYLRVPFFEFLQSDPNWTDVEMYFELMGLAPPDFSDDRGPAAFALEGSFDPTQDPQETFGSSEDSVGRAEAMVGLLQSATVQLAQIVNDYKKSELTARKRELENQDLSDPENRKAALTASAQIAKLEAALEKNVRFTCSQWRIKGI